MYLSFGLDYCDCKHYSSFFSSTNLSVQVSMIFRPRVAVKNRKRAKEKKANRQRIRAKEQESERSTFPRAAELTGKMELRVSARQGRRSQKLKEVSTPVAKVLAVAGGISWRATSMYIPFTGSSYITDASPKSGGCIQDK